MAPDHAGALDNVKMKCMAKKIHIIFDQTNCIFMTSEVRAFKPQHIREIHFLNQNFYSHLTETIS